MSDKLEVQKCHHCHHEWEPRVKKPKKCPQCQNPLWKSENPKKPKVKTRPVVEDAPTLTAVSEEAPLIPPTTDTNTEDIQTVASGADVYKAGNDMFVGRTALSVEPVEKLEPIYQRVEVGEPETAVQRLQREAEERMRRLVNQPI